ncbi:translation initiation factor IF-2 [Spirochaetia bacterium 38H-sp]|uniref:Translation initiation factor IF-2 n=1 Tax=Rarispira pelagica TaxID=3141764 RepID=A0ABU9UAX3_9SPIR
MANEKDTKSSFVGIIKHSDVEKPAKTDESDTNTGASEKKPKKKVVVVKKAVKKKQKPDISSKEEKEEVKTSSVVEQKNTTPDTVKKETQKNKNVSDRKVDKPSGNANDNRRPFRRGQGSGGQSSGRRPYSNRGGAQGQGRGPRQEQDKNQGGADNQRAGSGSKYRFKRPKPSVAPPPQQDASKIRQVKDKKKEYYKKDKEQEQEEKLLALARKKKKIETNPVPKEIDITEAITVSELARKMNLKASSLITKLMSMGMMVTINQQIDADTATILAEEFGCKVNVVSLYDETVIEKEQDSEDSLRGRAPVVTIMGHVDHGKTKLLDAIRSANVAEGEFGGITQHIGAYQVNLPQGKITFLDTPGHEAFTLMRARGAQVTDIVVLVVAANDGVMPQTVEAINHAKEAKVPIIVAINKIDLPEANPDRVKQQLSDYGLLPEDWGGSTLFCEVSALKRKGINELLETILLQAELLELKTNYDCRAEGRVLESKIDHGRGSVATVLVQRGTLKIGDPFVAGVYSGKVRAMFDDHGKRVDKAEPSTPVEILGCDGVPEAGDPFQVTENEKLARQVSVKRQELKKLEESKNVKKITLDNLYDSIQDGEILELKVIIKADVHGSAEAIKTALEKLSTREIRLSAIHAAAGAVNESDVRLASASNAIIIAFNVRPTNQASVLAEKEKVEIRKYNIIYDVVDDIKAAMEGMLSPDIKEEVIGLVEVRDTFKVPKIGTIAGCFVLNGKIKRKSEVNIIRDGVVIHTTRVSSLKRFKDDVREVDAGYECGIGLEGFNDIKVGDQFEVIEKKEVAKTLSEEKE